MKRPMFIVSLLLAVAALPAQSTANDELAWLTGHWCGKSSGEVVEEYWMSPHGGVLLGLARALKGDRTVMFEYTRIVRVDGVPTYIAQPNGVPPTSFQRTAGGADWIRFENPGHDFPKRIEYRRKGAGLYAEASGPGRDGKESVLTYDYQPCAR